MTSALLGVIGGAIVATISGIANVIVALIQSHKTRSEVAEVSRKVDPLSNGFAGDVSRSLRDLNVKFDRLDSKVDRVDAKVDRLDERVARLEEGGG